MKKLRFQHSTLALLAVLGPLLLLFISVGPRPGPPAPPAATTATVEARTITPSLFGIGTVEARYTYKIGPTFAGRVKRRYVHVGDPVKAGQMLGEMDPVDLDDRLRAQESAFRRAQAALREAEARQRYAQTQARRYEQLLAVRSASEETVTTKRQELQIAEAGLSAAQEELARARADRQGLAAQRNNLRLIAPVDGIVAARDADPGTTIVAGQTVVEVIDPKSLWINVRFDQIRASGLAEGLPARIVLRSRNGQTLHGRVLRIEPKADAVTAETLAKVVFAAMPQPLPPVGELAEVTVDLPPLPSAPTNSNAAVRRNVDKLGVWKFIDGDLRFTPNKPNKTNKDGNVQVHKNHKKNNRIVTYSEKPLTAKSRGREVDRIPGAPR